MYQTPLMFAFLCLLASGLLAVAQETATLSPNAETSLTVSANAADASVSETPTTVPSSASSPSTSEYHSTSSSSSSSSSTSSSSSPPQSSSSTSAAPSPSQSSSDGGILLSSSSSSASATFSSSSSQAPTTAVEIIKHREMSDPGYPAMVAAIVSGFCLLFVLILFLLIMALFYRHLGKEEPSTVSMQKPKKVADTFYTSQEPQSAQHLVTSMSIPSFGSSSSDPHLDSSSGVHYNRGFDVDYRPSGTAATPNGHEEGFKPIQIVAADVNPRTSSRV